MRSFSFFLSVDPTALPPDARAQRLRLRRVLHASATTVPVMGIVACMYALDMIGPQATVALLGLMLALVAGFVAVVASGLNRLFQDPSLTMPQIVSAACVLLLASAVASEQGRAIPLILIPLVFAFAPYRYGVAALLRLAMVLLALAVAKQVVVAMLWPHPGAGASAALETAAMAVALFTYAAIGGQANELRRRTYFERAMAGMALAEMNEAVVALDREHRVRYANPAAVRLFAMTGTVQGRPVDDLFALPGGSRPSEQLRAHPPAPGRPAGRAVTQATTLKLAGGAQREVELTTGVLAQAEGEAVGYVLVARDVAETNRMIRELSHNATHDALTGLANRRGFSVGLQAAATRAGAAGRPGADLDCLLVIDLDQFKVVNDTCGHAAGDDLLREVAQIIAEHFGDARSIARLGGDEFGVLLRAPSLEACEARADALLRALTGYRFVRDRRAFRIDASIGITALDAWPAGAAQADADAWLAQADAACYLAKELGRGRVQVYRESDEDVARQQRELGWVSRLQHAIDHDGFELHAQRIEPAAAAEAGAPARYELLVRLRAPDGSLVPPGAFLSAAERFGLMPAIDRWVVARAVRDLGALARVGRPVPGVSINLSASTLRDGGLLQFVRERVAESGLDGRLLTFELTESAALLDLDKAREFILGLKRLDCRFALDDVGTGFSSLAHLRLLPLDEIKIDGSFVRTACDCPLDRVLVEALQRAAGLLKLATVAEFVEDDRIAQTMRDIGVTCLQGYGVHEPEPLARVLARH